MSNCPLMTAAAVDSAGAKLSTHDHERLYTGSAGAHPSRKFSSRAPRAAEAVDSPAPAVDSRASCPPTPPYLSTHENEHLDTCSAGRGHTHVAPAPPHHTLARHAPYTQTPRNESRTVRPGRRRASGVMGTAGWRPQQLSRRATGGGVTGAGQAHTHNPRFAERGAFQRLSYKPIR